MQATICGVTPKVDVYKREVLVDFLKKEKEHFLNIADKGALYQNKALIETSGLNYFNILPVGKINTALKNLILKEYDDCEKRYPYLGEYFISTFFGEKVKTKTNLRKFEKRYQKDFLNSISNKDVKIIIEWMFDNVNLERSINIDRHEGKDICLEKEDSFSLNLSYDYDFFNPMNNVTFRDYKFIIINGYIESVGEVHHLFTKANETKIPYVIFCYGMSEEVKHNIMVNNKRGSFVVLPVSLDSNDENTLNILNDIAVLHDGDIVSSDMGQTISQEVRKELKTGKKISFKEGRIYLDPVASNEKLDSHKKFLIKRLEDALNKPDVNVDPIRNRVKNFSVKSLNIYVPDEVARHNSFQRDMTYCLGFLKNIDKEYKILSIGKKDYYIPKVLVRYADEKRKSLESILENIDIILS